MKKKKKLLTRVTGIVLSAAVLFTSVPVSAAGTAEDSASDVQAVKATATHGMSIAEEKEPVDFDNVDWKSMTDAEFDRFSMDAISTDQRAYVEWLSKMDYRDYALLLSRDTLLNDEVEVYTQELTTDNGLAFSEDGEGFVDVDGNSVTEDEIETSDMAVEKMSYHASLFDNYEEFSEPSRFPALKASTWQTDTALYQISFQRNGVALRADTVKVTGMKGQDASSKATSLTAKYSVGTLLGINNVFTCNVKTEGNSYTWAECAASGKNLTCIRSEVYFNTKYDWTQSVTNATGAHETKMTNSGNYYAITCCLLNAGVSTSTQTSKGSCILNINMTVPEYVVTYDGNGATSGSVASAVYATDSTDTFKLAKNAYEKKFTLTLDEGASIGESEPKTTSYAHTFNGWSADPNAGYGFEEERAYTPEKNITFYAQWKVPSVTLPAPAEKEHFNFTGWTLTKTGRNADGTEEQKLPAGWPVDLKADTTYYAQWEHKIANYKCYHYVQKEVGKTNKDTDYELVDTIEEWGLEDGTVKSLDYSQKAIDAANSMVEGYECDLPQLQVVTLPEGDSEFAYFYNLKTSYVEYTVNHYVQKEAGKNDKESEDDYELIDTTTDMGQAGTMVTLPYSEKAISTANSRQQDYQCVLPTEQKVTLIKGKEHTYSYYYDIDTNVVSYTIYHYVQKEAGKTNKETDYELADTTFGSGNIGDTVTLQYSQKAADMADAVTGYECSYPQSIQTTLKAGQTVYYYYYNLKSKNASGGNTSIDNSSKTYNYFNDYGLTEEQVKDIVNNIEKNGTATFTIDGVKYTIVRNADGTFSITFMVTDKNGSLTVPSYIKLGDKVYTINNIADNAFKGNKTIKSVVISNGITTIGNYAFYGCTNLETVYMPNTILKVGRYAFAKCTKLKKVRMSGNCYELGKGVFSDDKALTKITLGSKLTKVPDSAFKNCKKLKSIQIPKNVTTIGKQAFYGCSSLKTVKIKTTVLKKVGSKAFKRTTKNIKIKVPKSKVAAYTKLLKGKYGK